MKEELIEHWQFPIANDLLAKVDIVGTGIVDAGSMEAFIEMLALCRSQIQRRDAMRAETFEI